MTDVEESTNDSTVPESRKELMPTMLYLVEILLLPFFWLGPVLVAGLGGMMARDAKRLNKKYDCKLGDIRYVWYFIPITIGHFGSIAYRAYRRQQVLKHTGLETSAASRFVKENYNSKNYLLFGWFLAQLLLFIVLAVLPESAETLIEWTGTATAFVFLANVVVGPILVWWDLRRIRQNEYVEWGWTRFLHILVSAVPLLIFVYLAQRIEHLYYAMIVETWETPAEELQLEDAEKSRLEEFADQMDDLF